MSNFDRLFDPFFDVVREPLFTESGIPVMKEALVNADTNQVLGVVSPGYELIENEQVATLFDNALEEYPKYDVQDHADSIGKRWKRRIIFDKDELVFDIDGKGDTLGVMIEVFNGYDARTAYGFEMLAFRHICENGLVMGKRKLFAESFVHFSNEVDRLLQAFEMKFDAFKNNVLTWQKWTEEDFNKADFQRFIEDRVKSETNKKGFLSEKIGVSIVDHFEPTLDRFSMDENKWGAFNVLTYVATHETKARKGSNLFSNRYKTVNRLATDLYEHKNFRLAA